LADVTQLIDALSSNLDRYQSSGARPRQYSSRITPWIFPKGAPIICLSKNGVGFTSSSIISRSYGPRLGSQPNDHENNCVFFCRLFISRTLSCLIEKMRLHASPALVSSHSRTSSLVPPRHRTRSSLSDFGFPRPPLFVPKLPPACLCIWPVPVATFQSLPRGSYFRHPGRFLGWRSAMCKGYPQSYIQGKANLHI